MRPRGLWGAGKALFHPPLTAISLFIAECTDHDGTDCTLTACSVRMSLEGLFANVSEPHQIYATPYLAAGRQNNASPAPAPFPWLI
jgi:hypothetical protein